MEVEVSYKSGLCFSTSSTKHVVTMDALPENGGKEEGLTPKELLLASLAGCTGMDVVSILKKMRQSFSDFKIQVSAEKNNEEPIVFTKIHIKYLISGKEIDKEKVQKAVQLSQDKYCGISAMLKKACAISWEIVYI